MNMFVQPAIKSFVFMFSWYESYNDLKYLSHKNKGYLIYKFILIVKLQNQGIHWWDIVSF